MDIYRHFLAFLCAGAISHDILFSDWFSYSLFYCYTAAKIAGVMAVSCDDTLLGQSVDPDSIDEISDS